MTSGLVELLISCSELVQVQTRRVREGGHALGMALMLGAVAAVLLCLGTGLVLAALCIALVPHVGLSGALLGAGLASGVAGLIFLLWGRLHAKC